MENRSSLYYTWSSVLKDLFIGGIRFGWLNMDYDDEITRFNQIIDSPSEGWFAGWWIVHANPNCMCLPHLSLSFLLLSL